MLDHADHIPVSFSGEERAKANSQDVLKRKVKLQAKFGKAVGSGTIRVLETLCGRRWNEASVRLRRIRRQVWESEKEKL